MFSGAAIALTAAPAMAQNGDSTAAAEVADEGDAIVVTARKREETLLEVPIAVSAFNSASIQDKMAQDITDRLVKAGVVAILNFVPLRLQTPPHVQVRYVDLSLELESLSYYLKD